MLGYPSIFSNIYIKLSYQYIHKNRYLYLISALKLKPWGNLCPKRTLLERYDGSSNTCSILNPPLRLSFTLLIYFFSFNFF